MTWECITRHGSGTLYKVCGNINVVKYIEILDNQICSVIGRHFPNDSYVFRDDNVPVDRPVQWGDINMTILSMAWCGRPNNQT